MEASLPLLVFSDLDGTLIDHHNYGWGPAKQALARLEAVGAGVVLASSKTAAEMIPLQNELGLSQWPAIVENGAGVLNLNAAGREQPKRYDDLITVLNSVPDCLRAMFQGFNDMDPSQVADTTGLSLQAASKAKDRWYSEPGSWVGSSIERDKFLRYLSQQGVFASQGGRFLTLSFGQTKADVIPKIVSQLAPRYTVALGDAPNDIEMLQATDFGIVVNNPNQPELPVLQGEANGRIIRTTLSGPAGWNEAILEMIDRLNLNTNHGNN